MGIEEHYSSLFRHLEIFILFELWIQGSWPYPFLDIMVLYRAHCKAVAATINTRERSDDITDRVQKTPMVTFKFLSERILTEYGTPDFNLSEKACTDLCRSPI